MNQKYAEHPNPAHSKPRKLHYESENIPMGLAFPAELSARRNVAFTTGADMFWHAASRILAKADVVFVPVAWGFVNCEPISAIGFLGCDEGSYIFTPLKYWQQLLKAKQNNKSVCQIGHDINDLYKEAPEDFVARRPFITLKQRYSRSLVDIEAERVGRLFADILCCENLAADDLYDWI